MNRWIVYMVRCSDGSLYTGITTDLRRRVDEHNSGDGAKYTRSKRPIKVVRVEMSYNQSEALKREYEIKSMSKAEKEKLT